jgi:IS5 family transposase
MGGKQLGFGDYEQSTAKKQTKREKFLSEMDQVVPWQALSDLIEPFYPKTGSKGGRPPYPLLTMLRIHLMQQWYSLSDPAMEDALIEVPVMRRFAGIDWIGERIPDETTILAFRHLLEKHELGQRIFDTVKAHLKAKGMAMKQGTIIDATLIAAPTSTKNKQGERDPEMHQTKKGNQWYYGMKVHIGVDAASGLIHSVETTAANVHDLTPAAKLLHGEETVVYADAGYQGIAKLPEMKGKKPLKRGCSRGGQSGWLVWAFQPIEADALLMRRRICRLKEKAVAAPSTGRGPGTGRWSPARNQNRGRSLEPVLLPVKVKVPVDTMSANRPEVSS